jgi:hypothetical protein
LAFVFSLSSKKAMELSKDMSAFGKAREDLLWLALKVATLAGLAVGWVFTDRPESQRLSGSVHAFSIGCERLLSVLAQRERLTQDETELIEYYCDEVHTAVSQQQRSSVQKG